MTNRMNNYSQEHVTRRMPVGTFLIVIAVTEAIALILGVVEILSRLEYVVLVLATAAIAVGVAFTITEMQRLGNERD